MNDSLTFTCLKTNKKASWDRPKHSSRPDGPETSKEDKKSPFKRLFRGMFSGIEKEASVSGWKVWINLPRRSHNVETGLLQLLIKHISFCQACHEFTYAVARVLFTLWVNLVQQQINFRKNRSEQTGHLERKRSCPKACIVQSSSEALGIAFMFLPSKTESVSSLYCSCNWFFSFFHRISKQVRVTAL